MYFIMLKILYTKTNIWLIDARDEPHVTVPTYVQIRLTDRRKNELVRNLGTACTLHTSLNRNRVCVCVCVSFRYGHLAVSQSICLFKKILWNSLSQ